MEGLIKKMCLMAPKDVLDLERDLSVFNFVLSMLMWTSKTDYLKKNGLGVFFSVNSKQIAKNQLIYWPSVFGHNYLVKKE